VIADVLKMKPPKPQKAAKAGKSSEYALP